MYTPDEKKAILELEAMGCKTRYETSIKEVEGGFIVTHQITYVDGDEVKGVGREQIVCADHYGVGTLVAALYGDVREKENPLQELLEMTKTQTFQQEQ